MTSITRWFSVRKTVAVVVLTTTAALGVGGAAHAASPAGSVSSVAASSGTSAPAPAPVPAPAFSAPDVRPVVPQDRPASPVPPAGATSGAESRSAFTTLVSALQKIPGLWSKFSAAVKKSYAAFVPLWNQIKVVLGAVGSLISASSVWKYFH
jgi:hypothetical protein